MSLDFNTEQLPKLDILLAEQCHLPSSTSSSEPPSPSPQSIISQNEQNEPVLQPASSTSTHSSASLPTPPRSIKFAPFPELAPRKRRSNAPLGMAARGVLARRRRPGDIVDIPPDVPQENIRYLTPDEFAAHRMHQEMLAARAAQQQGLMVAHAARQLEAQEAAAREEVEQEARMTRLAAAAAEELLEIARRAKPAKISFWRRLIYRRGSESSLRKKSEMQNAQASGSSKSRWDNSLRRIKSDIQKTAPTPSKSPPPPLPPLRPILASVKSNISVGTITPNAIKTETHVEGRTINPEPPVTKTTTVIDKDAVVAPIIVNEDHSAVDSTANVIDSP